MIVHNIVNDYGIECEECKAIRRLMLFYQLRGGRNMFLCPVCSQQLANDIKERLD